MEAIKYIKYSLMSLAVAAGFSACNYLDKVPEDQLTLEMVFEDKIRTEDWLAGVYSGIPDPLWGYFKREGFNTMSDDMTIPSEWQPFGWESTYKYTVGSWTPSNNWLGGENYWDALPRRIRNGNIFLQRVHALPGEGLSEEMVENMKYEVRFLKAYYYSLMLEVYGPVPFAPDEIESPSAQTDELMRTQTPYDEIVNWIDKELLEVSKHLPAVYDNNVNWGRATSVMALAIRAKTLLYAASPLFNGNPAYKDWKNGDGVLLFSPYDASKWARAAAAFKDLLTLAHSNGYELYKEYNDDGSIDPFMSYYNLSLKRFSEGNKEILFGRAASPDLNNFQNHHLPKGIGGNAGMGVTQELVDAFYMKDGTAPILGYKEGGQPIINPEATLYSESGFSDSDEHRKTKWQGGGGNGKVTLAGTYRMYCNREPRFYVSVIFNEAWLGVANRRVNFYMGGPDTANSFDAPQNGYNVRKRISLDVFPKDNKHTYQPGILYRLADAYLGYAEALNESDPGNADILKYINLVRERAGIPAVTGGTQNEIRDLVRRERRVELNMEGARFNDLRRWLLADQYLDGRFYGMNFNGREKSDDPNNSNAYYLRTYHRERTFTPKMYLWPVPQDEMDKNPNLTQAPGYDTKL